MRFGSNVPLYADGHEPGNVFYHSPIASPPCLPFSLYLETSFSPLEITVQMLNINPVASLILKSDVRHRKKVGKQGKRKTGTTRKIFLLFFFLQQRSATIAAGSEV